MCRLNRIRRRKSADAHGVIFPMTVQCAFYAFRSLAQAITELAIAMTKNRIAPLRKVRNDIGFPFPTSAVETAKIPSIARPRMTRAAIVLRMPIQ